MKKAIKSVFRQFGLDIIKYQPDNTKKTKRTNALSYFETATGNYYLPTDAHDDIVANTIKSNAIFESEVVDLARKYIKPGTAVLDVGSNFGQMAVLFAQATGNNGKVYAFDADDFIFEILRKNIAANNKEGIIIPTFGAVHNRTGEILYFPVQDFERFGAYGSYGIDYNASKGREVRTLTIDSLEIPQPISFMKVDIQGGDLQAMQGAVNTIQKNKMPILFEYEYHFEDEYKLSFQEYVDFVQSIGYKFEKVINGHNYLIVPKQ